MKKIAVCIMIIFVLFSLVQAVLASPIDGGIPQGDELQTPDRVVDDYTESLFSYDITGIIIILLCTAGSGLIIFFLVRIKQKNKNQISD